MPFYAIISKNNIKSMTDNAVRHMVCIIACIICLIAYYAGWLSSQFGWWWTSLSILIVYGGMYKILSK